MFTEKLKEDEIQDVVISLSRAYDILEFDPEEFSYKTLSLSDRAAYLERVEEIMINYYYDKLTAGMSDDEITPAFESSIEEKVINWLDIVELATKADFFDSLYRFVDRIANPDRRLVVIGLEIQKFKVIVDYGTGSRCRS